MAKTDDIAKQVKDRCVDVLMQRVDEIDKQLKTEFTGDAWFKAFERKKEAEFAVMLLLNDPMLKVIK